MDLWVRSQDRESLTQVSNVQYSCLNGKHYIATYYDNLKVLGEYISNQRALEVLDEIQELLEDNVAMYDDEGYPTLLENIMIYEMPEV